MSCLCYCVGHQQSAMKTATIRGVGGRLVYQISHRHLRAVVSRVTREDLTPDLCQVRAYEQVVNTCHRQGTVIPLRFGCVAPEESQVSLRLAEHEAHFEALLQELAGCVEMGLRILLPSGPWGAVIPGGPEGCREVAEPLPPEPAPPPERLGLAYLTARKAHYASQDRWTQDYRRLADLCRDHFAGLTAQSRIDAPSPRLPLLSLFFLIPRDAVARFRHLFRQLAQKESARLLLSGPWPPYNFVTKGPSLI